MTSITAPSAHAQPAAEDDSAGQVDRGRAALKRGDFDEAADALDEALRLNPRRLDAYILRAAVHAQRKEYARGVALMRKADALAPDDLDVDTALGTQLVLAGEDAEGGAMLEAVVAREPLRYDAQLVLAGRYGRAGRHRAAATAYAAYFDARPAGLADTDARYRVEMADALLRAGQPGRALTEFTTALASRPRDLRARVGQAWAQAAVDCTRAVPLLAGLEEVAAKVPDVWLVSGQCALAQGEFDRALAHARRYLDGGRTGSAAGHALLGEVQAARGDLVAAREAFATARSIEPTTRRWAVRSARVTRQAGDLTSASAVLASAGIPEAPDRDVDWWIERAEIELARGQVAEAIATLAPSAAALPEQAAVQVVYGEALVRAERFDEALPILRRANQARPSQRSRAWLSFVLQTQGTQALRADDVAGAQAKFTEAEAADGSAAASRNLAITLHLQGLAADAVAAGERAAKLDDSAPTWHVLARARAGAGDASGARKAYERAAARATGADAVAVALSLAKHLVDDGDGAGATLALDKVSAQAKKAGGAVAVAHATALGHARHAAGLAALRGGQAARAVDLLEAAVAQAPDAEAALAIRCDLALASVAAGARDAAKRLKAVSGKACPFPAPADTQAVPILLALNEGLDARRAARALDRLVALDAKATGATKALSSVAIRVVALTAADAAYRAGKLADVRKHLATAKRAATKQGADELAVDQAILELAEGRVATAVTALERLAPRVPEAWIHVGLAAERQGRADEALEAWRKAKRAGVRFAPLDEWIEGKAMIYGDEPGKEPR